MSDRSFVSAPGNKRQDAPEYSYWRVWVDDDSVRVARDWLNAPRPRPQLQPQHLVELENGYLGWEPHRQGGSIPEVALSAFIAWLDQGGASDAS